MNSNPFKRYSLPLNNLCVDSPHANSDSPAFSPHFASSKQQDFSNSSNKAISKFPWITINEYKLESKETLPENHPRPEDDLSF